MYRVNVLWRASRGPEDNMRSQSVLPPCGSQGANSGLQACLSYEMSLEVVDCFPTCPLSICGVLLN